MSEPIVGRNLLIGGGAAACAACCAAPVLAVIGVTVVGTAATIAALAFAGVAFAIVIAALMAAGIVLRRRRARPATSCGPLEDSAHDHGTLPDPVRRRSPG